MQECTGEKYREIARAMGVKGVDEMSQEEYRKAAIDAVKKLSVDVGIPTKLEAIKEEDLQFLAESAHADACAPGNPKDASVEDLKDLFRKDHVIHLRYRNNLQSLCNLRRKVHPHLFCSPSVQVPSLFGILCRQELLFQFLRSEILFPQRILPVMAKIGTHFLVCNCREHRSRHRNAG